MFPSGPRFESRLPGAVQPMHEQHGGLSDWQCRECSSIGWAWYACRTVTTAVGVILGFALSWCEWRITKWLLGVRCGLTSSRDDGRYGRGACALLSLGALSSLRTRLTHTGWAERRRRQIVELLEESAKRTFDRTGILMRKPSGFTAEGLQKKATGRALFSKLMYLADLEQLLPGLHPEHFLFFVSPSQAPSSALSTAPSQALGAVRGLGFWQCARCSYVC